MILAIASIIPGVSGVAAAADAAVIARVDRERQERLEYLITCLEEGLDDFAGPIPFQESDPIIHAAYATIEATLRTSRREKIRAFAGLLTAGMAANPRLDLENEHEDYLKILDDLSLRELKLLFLLSHFEQSNSENTEEKELISTESYWDDFETTACDRLVIPKMELWGLLTRLTRTGMFEPIIGTHLGYAGGRGKLTGAYRRLESLLSNGGETFDTGSRPR
jgi:hypothetical protein